MVKDYFGFDYNYDSTDNGAKPINYRSTTGRWYDRRHETTTDKPVNMVNVISTTEESSTMEDDYGFDYNYDSTDNGTDEGTMVRNNNLNKHECWPMRH